MTGYQPLAKSVDTTNNSDTSAREDDRSHVFDQFQLGTTTPPSQDAQAGASQSKPRVLSRSRQYVRNQRLRMEEEVRSRPIKACGFLTMIVAVSMLVAGSVEVSGAHHERRHGWVLTTCMISHNYHNDTECIYFTVTPNLAGFDGRSLCAVPAAIASEAWFYEPPACSHLNRADADDIVYWRELGNTQVECYVPINDALGPIDADVCAASASNRGPSAVVWRSWVDRFVYLVRRPLEGSGAIEAVTRPRMNAGMGLITTGFLVLIAGLCCAFNRCVVSATHAVASQPPRINRYYQHQHAVNHKLY